jgi:hypothetical protein
MSRALQLRTEAMINLTSLLVDDGEIPKMSLMLFKYSPPRYLMPAPTTS